MCTQMWKVILTEYRALSTMAADQLQGDGEKVMIMYREESLKA